MNKTFAVAAVALALGTAPVAAADPPLFLPETTATAPRDGFYAGVLGGFWNGNSFYLLGGATVGANVTLSNNLVLGVEGRGVLYSDGDLGFDGTARLGVAVDQALVYGDGGLGVRDGAGHLFVGAAPKSR